jgi:hypothetical protein
MKTVGYTVDQDALVHWRYARRIGELVPDAHYACALERPRVSRRTIMRVWVGVIVLLAVALAVAKVAA